ncbi:MAG: RHS repeat-associated core domain-containing protein, partial [Gemmatimonadaceae bacterium]
MRAVDRVRVARHIVRALVGASLAFLVGFTFVVGSISAQQRDTTKQPVGAGSATVTPQGVCLNCGPGDEPPSVGISPGTGTFGGPTQTVTVDWCDDIALSASTRAITVNGVNVTSQFTYATVTPSPCGDEEKSVGTVTLQQGTNTIAASIKDGHAQLGSASETYTLTQLVIVTPDSGTGTSYATVRDTAAFTVKNPTAGSLTYTLSTSCPTGWTCSAPASLTVAAGVSSIANVAYTPVTSGTSGAVVLTATPPAGASSADAGTYHITVPVTVSVRRFTANITYLAYVDVPGRVGFEVGNASPKSSTYTLSGYCSGTAATACTVDPTITVPAGSTELVFEGFTPGDSNSFGRVGLKATGSDGGNVAGDTAGVRVVGSMVTCDTGRGVTACGDAGDRTPPLVVILPSQITRNLRTDTLVVDYCDNGHLSSPGVVTMNGVEVVPQFPDSMGTTVPICSNPETRHSPGVLTLLPGANSVAAFRCDDTGNCSEGDAIYTYTVLDIATADSAQMRRGAGSTFTQKFRVTNIGHETYTYSLSASCTGPGVTACTMLAPTSVTLNHDQSTIDSVSYQTPSTAIGQAGIVSIVASPVLNPHWSASGSVNVRTITPLPLLSVTPDSAHVPAAALLPNTYKFWVRNLGNLREIVSIAATCSSLTNCSSSPTSKVMAPGDSILVAATFTAGAVDSSGSVVVTASSTDASAHATLFVHAQPKDLPVASLDSVWTPGRVERSMCVTVAVGTGGTADECGDLRVAVAASAVRTLGETRAPTLLYGSADASAAVVVPVRVGFLAQATIPDSVRAVLVVGGVARDSGSWVKAQWAAGATRQIALAVDGRTLSGGPGGASDHTGIYPATLQVASYTGATRLADTLSTTIPIVDRSQSAFGAGWWLAGLERLYFPTDGTLTWVGGDGSIRTYTKDPAHPTIYRAPSLTRLDSLVKDAGGQYIRYLANRLHVRFNGAGQHIATVTRLGDSTVFVYNASGQLQTITVAPVSAAKTYTFTYDASGRLSTVAAPLGGANGTTPRLTTFAPVGTTRQIASATLANGSVIRLAYDPAHVGRVLTITDPRSTTTTFTYDIAGKLTTSTIGMKGVTSDLVTHFTTSASLGVRGTAAVDTGVVATRIDGPRTDVVDTTVIRVTALGAPRRVTDALGHVTALRYRDKNFPGLVTHEHRLDAAASVATYDTKGHLTAETDSTTYADGALGDRTYATTTYQWDPIWDEVTMIVPPLRDSTVMTYDPATGNRLTQRDVVGDTAHFGYNAGGRLVSVRRATHAASDSLTYDALGNVAQSITPLGFVTTTFRDGTGRDTLVQSPIDSAKLRFTSSRTVYDLADRPTLTRTFGPPVPFRLSSIQVDSTPAETLTVVTVYDSGGLVRRVTRTAQPDVAQLDSLVTSMGYDPAGRKVVDTATNGAADTYRYDAAGHLIQHDTRDTLSVLYQYDALGELSQRTMDKRTSPGTITFDNRFPAWAPPDFAIQPDGLATFTYDAGGRQITANNSTADVHRSYLPNGALLTDTTVIHPWDVGSGADAEYGRIITYDLDGRRRATHGLGGDTLNLDAAGRVIGIGDPGGHWFLYHYDALGRPDLVTYANGGKLMRTYDAEDEVTRRTELDPAGAILHNDTLAYDARGKVIYALDTVEQAYEGYSALGTLWSSIRENKHDPGFFKNDERFVADAMGNVVLRVVHRANSSLPTIDSTATIFARRTGRLLVTSGTSGQSATAYTAAGERDSSISQPRFSTSASTADRYYYRPDGLLIAVDHRSCIIHPNTACVLNGLTQFELPTGAFEEYRYDALGRRVLTRTLTDSVCATAPCVNAIMQVVFDGAQIAAEIRAPATALDSVAVGDSRGIQLPPPPNGAGAAFYGTVAYLNGPELDQPLEIQNIVPYRNWRGLIDGGQCMSVCGIGNVTYPGASYEAYLSLIPSTQSAPTGWHGTLFDEGQDESGLMYRRNRYYDPATGQFTQEDPLGLAGGANAYGFGNGDPVSFSDPF